MRRTLAEVTRVGKIKNSTLEKYRSSFQPGDHLSRTMVTWKKPDCKLNDVDIFKDSLLSDKISNIEFGEYKYSTQSDR